MDYGASLSVLRDRSPYLAPRVEKFVTLEHVLNWLNADGYPLGQLDMVTQDEYSHDLLIPMRDGDWHVFAMT